MKKLGLLIFLISSLSLAQNAWINEFHYNNVGADVNEFVEVAIQNPGDYNLADFKITLYNGATGRTYRTARRVSTFVVGILNPNTNIQLFYTVYPSGRIQNGNPDGICLDYQGTPILFISYGGSFTATNGVANGLISNDIGITEPSNAPLESSLGLTGSGTTYSQMTWAYYPASSTTGDPNGGQELPVELTSFSATKIGKDIKLTWNTSTEINNFGFEIERSVFKGEWNKIGFVNGNGNSNSPKNYSFVDDKTSTGRYSYRLKQIDNDGQFEYSKIIEIDVSGVKGYELTQNYPNPFNPTTTIQYILPQTGMVRLTLYNVLGEEIRTLVNEIKDAGTHTLNINADNLNSGIYIYRIESGSFVQSRKMTIIK